uniref:Uncharacterized protein n=1 Tax=Tanacetum cinerariifolium TaxID=118510 RepID=A0A6L2KN29_TANCI|nr:hypothetical protein [Tanacetum cinerariifolium]
MNPVATQQVALDNSLVAPKKRQKIEKCNARIVFSKPQREETYQVTLEALKLSPCYPAFVITTEVLEIYKHQFWTTIKKIENSYAYEFKLDKKKFRVDTEVFREILQICPRILNQYFIEPPSEKELVTFIQELGYSGKCNMLSEDFMYQADNTKISSVRKEYMPYPIFTKVIINNFISKDNTISMRNMMKLHTARDDSLLSTLKFVSKTQDYQQYGALILDDMINQDMKDCKAYKTYYDFATRKVPPRKARKYKKVASPSRKLSPIKEAEPVKKAKRVKRSAKKSATAPTTGVVIKDTHVVSVSKKKEPAKGDGVGSQLDKGTSTKLWVLDVPSYEFDSDDKSWGDSEDESDDINDDENVNDDDSENEEDDGSDAYDIEKTDSSDDDKNPSFTLKGYNKEEHDEEYESDDDNENVFEEEDDDLYKDVDVKSLGAEHKKERKALLDFPLFGLDQRVITLETELSKLEQADHFTQLLEFVKSQLPTMMDDLLSTRIRYATRTTLESYTKEFEKKAQEERKLYIDVVKKSVKDIIKDEVKSLLPHILPKEVSDFATPVSTSLTEFELKKIILNKIERSKSYQAALEHRELYDGLVKSYNLDKDLFSSYENVYSLKRNHDDKDKDEDPSAGSDRGLKKQKTSKDAEPPKGLKTKESTSSPSKGTKPQPKSFAKSVQIEELMFETVDTEMLQDQECDIED